MADTKEIYEKYFDAIAYANEYASEGCDMRWVVEDFYHDLFTKKKLRGNSLLDVGAGPTVRAAISASAYVPDIYLSEYLPQNRQVVEKWLRKDPDCVDFSGQFKYVAKLEGIEDYKKLVDRTRKSIKDVYFCDILLENPLHPRCPMNYDIVFSSLCLDCYPKDEDYLKGMKNLSNLIKPGGYLAFVSSYKGSNYTVGGHLFYGTVVDENKLQNSMNEAGLKILELNKHFYNKDDVDGTDNQGFVTVFAQKV